MDPRMNRFNFFMTGCCIGLAVYSGWSGDRVAGLLWSACAFTFLAFSTREG